MLVATKAAGAYLKLGLAVPLLDQVIMGWEDIVEEGQGQLEWGLFKRVSSKAQASLLVCILCNDCTNFQSGGGVRRRRAKGGWWCFARLRIERTLSEQ